MNILTREKILLNVIDTIHFPLTGGPN